MRVLLAFGGFFAMLAVTLWVLQLVMPKSDAPILQEFFLAWDVLIVGPAMLAICCLVVAWYVGHRNYQKIKARILS